MKIGVVSDTHDRLANVGRIVESLNQLELEWVVHTGDVTTPETLRGFAELRASLVVVPGNNDHDLEGLARVAEQLSFEMSGPTLERRWQERSVFAVHDPEDVDIGELCRDAAAPDLLLHGHTHRYRWERIGCTWVFNPGECAGFIEGLGAVGVVDLETLEASLLRV